MAKSEEANFQEALRLSMEELRVQEAKKISQAEANSSGEANHTHKGATSDAEEAYLLDLIKKESMGGRNFAAAGHGHRGATSDAEEDAQLARALEASRPMIIRSFKIIDMLNEITSKYYKNEQVSSFVSEASIYIGAESEWTGSEVKGILHELESNSYYSAYSEVQGFVAFVADSIDH